LLNTELDGSKENPSTIISDYREGGNSKGDADNDNTDLENDDGDVEAQGSKNDMNFQVNGGNDWKDDKDEEYLPAIQ
jgi:hypothetical protein